MNRSIESAEYVIVDTETTGLLNSDRVVEIAMIRVDSKGKVLDEFVTLVNPLRAVTGGDIHGLSDSDVKHAPTFKHISGDVMSLLRSAVFVAHNAAFDLRMIKNEFARVGVDLPTIPVICTISIAKLAFGALPQRKLGSVCKFLDIELQNAHSAYADAQATAEILVRSIAEIKNGRLFDIIWQGTYAETWPDSERSGLKLTRQEAIAKKREDRSYLQRLTERLPVVGKEPPEFDQYYHTLDRVLADRLLDAKEALTLIETAADLGISKVQLVQGHRNYFERLVDTALADGVISNAEASDLAVVGDILGIPSQEQIQLIEAGRKRGKQSYSANPHSTDLKGQSVCFTGECKCALGGEKLSRDRAQQLAVQRGLIVKNSVSKKLNILVVADPESMSGKATKARDLGIRIIAEPDFWQLLGAAVD